MRSTSREFAQGTINGIETSGQASASARYWLTGAFLYLKVRWRFTTAATACSHLKNWLTKFTLSY